MIVQLNDNITMQQMVTVIEKISSLKYTVKPVTTQFASYLVCKGDANNDIRYIGHLDGVKDVHIVSDSFKLVSGKWKLTSGTVVLSDDIEIGNGNCVIMAGPCAIESEAQVEAIADHLVANNVRIMRGGVFKPRSSPYSFRGLGIEGLKLFYSICHKKGIKIVSEVMEITQIEKMYEYVDIFQVGARNSQNFNLLEMLGKVDKPVLLKRGISGTIEELLQSAEYIFSNGNERLILCERGIRTYENGYRNTFDINAIAILKQKTHLPVIADPSHGIGIREHVAAIAKAAIVAGADGVIYEVHPLPEEAMSDGQQTLNFEESAALIKDIYSLLTFINA